jgi:Asp/Glu/hydantoin racemase
MKKNLTLLHTGYVHISTFERMLEAYDHGMEIDHLVHEEFLNEALASGGIDESLAERIQAIVSEAITEGTDLVLCTCSSIGSAVEAMNGKARVEVQRIDRAMADEAVRLGSKITICAALKRTVDPTEKLLLSSAKKAEKTIELETLLIPHAWEKFESGDKQGYFHTIAAVLNKLEPKSEVIVLAQASMAGGLPLIERKSPPVLTSPKLGLEKALTRLGCIA